MLMLSQLAAYVEHTYEAERTELQTGQGAPVSEVKRVRAVCSELLIAQLCCCAKRDGECDVFRSRTFAAFL